MLDISAFVSNLNGEISLVYHGGNRYTITEAPRGFDGYELAVDILDDDFEDIIETRTYAASSVSSAIATIEAIERGEEV